MTNLDSIDQGFASAVITEALRLHIGPGKRFSYEQAADALGEQERTLKAWATGESNPRMHSLMKLMLLLGPAFANTVMNPIGYSVEPLEGNADDLKLLRVLGAAIDAVATALGDDKTPGRIDHIERHVVWPKIMALADALAPWMANNSPTGARVVPISKGA